MDCSGLLGFDELANAMTKIGKTDSEIQNALSGMEMADEISFEKFKQLATLRRPAEEGREDWALALEELGLTSYDDELGLGCSQSTDSGMWFYFI